MFVFEKHHLVVKVAKDYWVVKDPDKSRIGRRACVAIRKLLGTCSNDEFSIGVIDHTIPRPDISSNMRLFGRYHVFLKTNQINDMVTCISGMNKFSGKK